MANENFIFDESMLAETLPTGIINLGDDNHIANMANFSMYANAKQAVSGNPIGEPTGDLRQDELRKFGDWIGDTGVLDTKMAARSLKDFGLVGADQIIDAQPNLSDADSIKNSQADWKVSAVQQILSNAKRLGIRKPEEVLANKDVLVANPRWRDAINNDTFQTIHPNFWSVITDKILPKQYAKYDSKQINQTAKK